MPPAPENTPRQRSRRTPHLADLALFLIVCLIYASVVTARYAFLDDYLLLSSALHHDGQILRMNHDFGRPLAGWIMDASFNAINSVADLRWLRLAGILGFALAALVIRRIATRAGWNLFTASCLALLMVTLPSVQVYVGWTTLWFYGYIICLTAAALLLLDAALTQPQKTPRLALAAAAATTAILILVGLTYQPMLFLYIPLFLLRYWATPKNPGQLPFKTAALHAAALAAALITCFCIFKLGPHPSTRGTLPTNWLAKALWFFEQPLVHALNLLNIDVDSHPKAECFALLTLAVIFAGSRRAFWRRPPWPALAKMAVIPCAFVLTYLPNLITVESWPAFRSAYAIYCTSLVAFIWALHQLAESPSRQRLWHGILASLTILACLLAQIQCRTLFAQPQQAEFNLMRTLLAKSPIKAGDRVLLVQPEFTDSSAWIQLYDEFGIPSSCVTWVPRDMFWITLRETHPELTQQDQTVALTLTREVPTHADADVVIDMKTALQQLHQ